MLTVERLVNNRDDLAVLADAVDNEDIRFLVELLGEKDDTVRYAAFLLLQILSQRDSRVYGYWDTFAGKLADDNSYQRSLGLMLIAENIRWDEARRFNHICTSYLAHCNDEKFITARQCIQGLNKIVESNKECREAVIDSLMKIDLEKRKDSQKGLLLLDAVEVLVKLYQEKKDGKIEQHFMDIYRQGNEKVNKALKKYLPQIGHR